VDLGEKSAAVDDVVEYQPKNSDFDFINPKSLRVINRKDYFIQHWEKWGLEVDYLKNGILC
jgi:hypothetical protein